MNDLIISGSSCSIECRASRWDTQNYSTTIETWIDKSDLQSLISDVVPGAVGELYQILGTPFYYDKSWAGENTIQFKPIVGSRLASMRSNKTMFVKNLTTHPINSTDWIEIKLECYISGGTVNL